MIFILSMVRVRKGYILVGYLRGNVCLWFISNFGVYIEVRVGDRDLGVMNK